jgi:hypothetical protein
VLAGAPRANRAAVWECRYNRCDGGIGFEKTLLEWHEKIVGKDKKK